jgi:hypothetical protein
MEAQDLDWCINGCGKRSANGSYYCSGRCLAKDVVASVIPTFSPQSPPPHSPILLPYNYIEPSSLSLSFKNKPNHHHTERRSATLSPQSSFSLSFKNKPNHQHTEIKSATLSPKFLPSCTSSLSPRLFSSKPISIGCKSNSSRAV